jgi:hypothetical protein
MFIVKAIIGNNKQTGKTFIASNPEIITIMHCCHDDRASKILALELQNAHK